VVVPEQSETVIELPDTLRLAAGVNLTREINRLLGYNAVTTRCAVIPLTLKDNGRGGKKYPLKNKIKSVSSPQRSDADHAESKKF
jgi:hypothetical protein